MISSRQQFADTARRIILDTIVRRPVSDPAPEGTFTLVDNGTATSFGTRRAQAKFREGKWARPNGTELAFAPTYWLEIRND